MDLNDLWQENKRWILGCALGLVVFWIGWSVIHATFDPGPTLRAIRNLERTVRGGEFYDRAAFQAAREESEMLAEAVQRLREALVFKLDPDFSLEGKGDPDLHWDVMSRRVRGDLVRRADEAGVAFAESDLEWGSYDSLEEFRAALVQLCLVDHAVRRLLAAHERVRAAGVEAPGLVAIESFKLGGSRGRRGGSVRVRKQEGPVREDRVRFEVRADAATLALFLEACRAQSPPIGVHELRVTPGRRPGDPLTIKGTLTAIRVEEP